MRDALLLLVAAAAFYAGFACFALSQAKHWQTAIGGTPPHRRFIAGMRLVGSILLLCGFWLALLRDGPAFGALLGCVLISAAAVAVAFTLTWWPRPLTWMARPRLADRSRHT